MTNEILLALSIIGTTGLQALVIHSHIEDAKKEILDKLKEQDEHPTNS